MALVVGAAEDVYPVVAFSKSQFSVRTRGANAIKTPMKKALQITEATYKQIMTNKGVPSRAAAKWEGLITLNNVAELSGREGTYPYIAFDVVGHPLQKNKLIPIPSDVATRIFPKLYEDASNNPSKYGLKLDDLDEGTRARHQARLDIFTWVPSNCAREDADGKSKPCVISPPLNQWAQCPTAQQIPNLGKEMAADAPAVASKKTAKATGKRKHSSIELPEGIEESNEKLPSMVSRVVTLDTKGAPYKIVEHNGIVMVTMFKSPQSVKGPSSSQQRLAPQAPVDEEDAMDEEEEEDGDEDDD